MWLILASFTAVLTSAKDVSNKLCLKQTNEYIVAWTNSCLSLLLLLPSLWFTGIPALGDRFGYAVVISGSLNVLAIILYVKAIKISELSLTIPLITFTPLFLLVTSPVILGEYPSIADTVGIILIVIGAYSLNLKDKSKGYFAPLAALIKHQGYKYMLGVALIWSISSNFDKIGVQNSSPTFWIISFYAFVSLVLLPITIYKSQSATTQFQQFIPSILLVSIFNVAAITCQMTALDFTTVAQVIAIKRTSVLFTVIVAHFWFKEPRITERLFGAFWMIAGVF
jgi:drug/metabolite transporter (DMT)-like permease